MRLKVSQQYLQPGQAKNRKVEEQLLRFDFDFILHLRRLSLHLRLSTGVELLPLLQGLDEGVQPVLCLGCRPGNVISCSIQSACLIYEKCFLNQAGLSLSILSKVFFWTWPGCLSSVPMTASMLTCLSQAALLAGRTSRTCVF